MPSLKIFDIQQLHKIQEDTLAEIHRWEETLKVIPASAQGRELANSVVKEIEELRSDLKLIKQLRESQVSHVAFDNSKGELMLKCQWGS